MIEVSTINNNEEGAFFFFWVCLIFCVLITKEYEKVVKIWRKNEKVGKEITQKFHPFSFLEKYLCKLSEIRMGTRSKNS